MHEAGYAKRVCASLAPVFGKEVSRCALPILSIDIMHRCSSTCFGMLVHESLISWFRRTSTAVKSPLLVPSRTFIKYDNNEGRKISDPDVLERFYRLTWGGWIKKKMGTNKRVWKMSHRRYRRKDQHVLVSKRYSNMFDRMVTQYYRQPTYFINDPYEPYNKRHDLTHPYYEDKNDASQRKMFFPEINPAVLAKRKALDAAQQFSPTYL